MRAVSWSRPRAPVRRGPAARLDCRLPCARGSSPAVASPPDAHYARSPRCLQRYITRKIHRTLTTAKLLDKHRSRYDTRCISSRYSVYRIRRQLPWRRRGRCHMGRGSDWMRTFSSPARRRSGPTAAIAILAWVACDRGAVHRRRAVGCRLCQGTAWLRQLLARGRLERASSFGPSRPPKLRCRFCSGSDSPRSWPLPWLNAVNSSGSNTPSLILECSFKLKGSRHDMSCLAGGTNSSISYPSNYPRAIVRGEGPYTAARTCYDPSRLLEHCA